MSREVDPNASNLSDDDKLYLAQRGRLPLSVASVEEQRALLDLETTANIPLSERANTGDMNTAGITTEELEAELARRREVQDSVDPKSLFGSESGAAPDDDDDDVEPLEAPYEQYTKAELYSEVQRRNEDREEDEQIVVEAPGNKAEYVAALDEDDEE